MMSPLGGLEKKKKQTPYRFVGEKLLAKCGETTKFFPPPLCCIITTPPPRKEVPTKVLLATHPTNLVGLKIHEEMTTEDVFSTQHYIPGFFSLFPLTGPI